MKSDIEIAQSVQMKNITEIAAKAGVPEENLEQYGKYKAKVDLSLLNSDKNKNNRLLIDI